MDEIAEKMSTALGDAGAEKAMAGIAKQMQKLLASDVIYEQVVRPEVDGVLAGNGISDSDLPKSTFLPDEKWLEESTVSEALGAISGAAAATPRASTAPNSPASASTGPNWSKGRRPRSPAKKASKSKSGS